MAIRIVDWLRRLGMERYETAFRDNEIDGELLLTLTSDDLKEIGVIPIGHRRRLLNAIAELQVDPVAAVPPIASGSVRDGRIMRRHASERRQITILFSDLVGSTQLADRLDAEELRQVLIGYRDAVTGIVEGFDGFVAQYLGDGVLAYFGWPQAHEHDAERAVRASLEMVEVVARFGHQHRHVLSCRVGIATGPVIVGDLVGSSFADADQVVGRTPNLAARIQSIAAPGTIAISRETRTIVDGRFHLTEIGRHNLRGFAEPVDVWRVDRLRESELGLSPQRNALQVTFVGRQKEIRRLRALWRSVKDGAGKAVLVAGEPGIGKSRILEEISRHVTQRNGRVLRYQCSPFHSNDALYPILNQLRYSAYPAGSTDTGEDIQRFVPLFAAAGLDVPEATSLFQSMLSHRPGPMPPADLLDPRGRREKTFQALVTLFDWLVGRSQVLLLFEDLHWADPTTLEFLGRLTHRIGAQRVLALLTCRPDLKPKWSDVQTMEEMAITRLSGDDIQKIITTVVRDRQLSRDVRLLIAQRSDGIPLYAEELAKMVIEPGILDIRGRLLPKAFSYHSIPITLRDSLVARLDRFPEASEIVQTASAIGREFSADVLAAALGEGGIDLRAGLAQLVDAKIIAPEPRTPRGFIFKHALMRDAAYESVLRSDLLKIHRRIAVALEEAFRHVTPAHVIASHWALAGEYSLATRYFSEAASTARSRYANAEAGVYYRLALEQLEKAGAQTEPEADRGPKRIDLLEDLSGVLVLRHDVEGAVSALTGAIECVSEDTVRLAHLHRLVGVARQQSRGASLEALNKAETVLASLDIERDHAAFYEWFDIQLAKMNVFYWSGDGDAMSELAGRLTAHVDRTTPALRAEYYNQMVLRDLRKYRYRPVRDTVISGERYVESARQTNSLAILCSAHFILGFVHLHGGDLDDAEAAMSTGLHAARRSGHRAIELRCLSYLAMTYRRKRDVVKTVALSSRSLEMATQEKFSEYVALANAHLSWAAWRKGNLQEARAKAEHALEQLAQSSISYPFEWCALLPLIAVRVQLGDVRDVPAICARLTHPSQQELPDLLNTAVERVLVSPSPEIYLIKLLIAEAERVGFL